MIKIWHNSRCKKSRESLNYLKEQNCDIEVVEYLKELPSKDDLKQVISELGISASELLRTTEQEYKELNLKEENDEDKIIEAMLNNPKLIQRPIVVKDGKAVIGRPIQNVKTFLRN
ncbi:MAG: Arsenate reductase (EC [uncultured Campylobacterales bacterium]|uniref:Arsenate reductase (EC) n=1 Tax=uncultured Campylobacterales bacterium TaxID=352960 RepID=A0A6S6SWR2_9BACT|nr:MAG: Arsenate reductase (EC [uncultured Campylobacterales bacterium]